MSTIDRLLKGAIDIHIHIGPDPRQERSVDALQAARDAQRVGMRAIVLKSHDYPTAPVAYTASQAVPGIAIFGSLCLDQEVGGLNTHALEASAKMGAKIVWMPTFSSAHDMRKKNLEGGISILDGEGKLLPEVGEILEIIKSYRMVLATGHLSSVESFALVDEARKRNLSKILITHPLGGRYTYLTLEEQRQIVDKGALIEHCFNITMPSKRRDPMLLVEAVRTVGAEHCIMSTDFGQAFNPIPAEGMRILIAIMLNCGLSEKELELMVKINPARLLDLD